MRHSFCHVDNLESDWSRGIITTPAELRTKVETYINTLIRNKQWKSTHPAPTQPTALVTDETAKPRTSGKQTIDKDAIAMLKAKNALGNSTTLSRLVRPIPRTKRPTIGAQAQPIAR